MSDRHLVIIICLVLVIVGIILCNIIQKDITQYERLISKGTYYITVEKVDTGIEIIQYNKKNKKIRARIIEGKDSYTLYFPDGIQGCQEFISGKPIVQEK